MATKKLKNNPYDYLNIQQMRNGKGYTEDRLKAVYKSFRNTALKRMQRLEKAGFTQNKQYQRLAAQGIPSLSQLSTPAQLLYELRSIASFLTTKTSTVSGARQVKQRNIDQFRNLGLSINEKNVDKFTDFLEAAREKALARNGGSEFIRKVYQVYTYTQRHRLNPSEIMDDFDWWFDTIDQVETIRKIPKPKSGMKITAEYIKNLIEG